MEDVATRPTPLEIASTIAERDRAFAALIRVVGPPPVRRRAPVAGRFPTLARAITHQLLATKAANTIHGRVVELCGGEVSPESIVAAGHASLRAVGLSNAKAAAMVDLAERTLDGRLHLAEHGRMSDHDVIADVVEVRGVGVWTAHMYLMHTLARHDVWPSGDLGVRHGWTILHRLDEIVSEKELRHRGERFAGVRSDTAWYCWEAVHLERAK